MAVIRRIAVLRALPGLGDLLCAVPALRAIRAAHPDAEVSLIGLPGADWFADRFRAYVDTLIPLTAWPGLPETPGPAADACAFVEAVRRRHLDLVLQLHGDGTVTNDLISRLGASRVAGMARPGGGRPAPDGFVEISPEMNEVERLLAAVAAAGIPPGTTDLEWPELPADGAELAAEVPLGAPVAVLHPGATLPSRRWDERGFAAVGDQLAASGLRVVLTGVASERTVTTAVATAMKSPATQLAGRTSLGATAALVRRARVVVTNDTGMSHLAAAVDTPSVVIFTVTDPRRWKPAGDRHRAVVAGPLPSTVDAVLAALPS